MKVGYKFLDHRSDLYIESCGKTESQAFEQAGLAIFDSMTDIDTIDKKKQTRKISVESEDIYSLLYDYLEELLFIYDTEFLLCSEITLKIEEIEEGFKLEGVLKGEEYDEKKHPSKIGIKSPTYSQMEKIEKNGLICFKFVMDI
jgi:SHS2 domain-containing protein